MGEAKSALRGHFWARKRAVSLPCFSARSASVVQRGKAAVLGGAVRRPRRRLVCHPLHPRRQLLSQGLACFLVAQEPILEVQTADAVWSRPPPGRFKEERSQAT